MGREGGEGGVDLKRRQRIEEQGWIFGEDADREGGIFFGGGEVGWLGCFGEDDIDGGVVFDL